MDEKSVQFVIGIFDSETGAEEALKKIKKEKKAELEGVQAAVAMRKNTESGIHYKDVGMTPVKGAVAGVAMGAVVGILTGGTGLILGAVGALLGGVMGKRKREGHVAAEKINQVVASIPPGSSALLTIVEANAAVQFEETLQTSGGHTFMAEISADLAAALDEHAEPAHEALIGQLEK